jgi:hypothetical protein
MLRVSSLVGSPTQISINIGSVHARCVFVLSVWIRGPGDHRPPFCSSYRPASYLCLYFFLGCCGRRRLVEAQRVVEIVPTIVSAAYGRPEDQQQRLVAVGSSGATALVAGAEAGGNKNSKNNNDILVIAPTSQP